MQEYLFYFNGKNGDHLIYECQHFGWVKQVHHKGVSTNLSIIDACADIKQRSFLNQLLNIKGNIFDLQKYLLRAKLANTIADAVTIVFDDRGFDLLALTYDEFMKRPVIVTGGTYPSQGVTQQISESNIDLEVTDFLIEQFKRTCLYFEETVWIRPVSSRLLYYCFSKKCWLALFAFDEHLSVAYIDKEGKSHFHRTYSTRYNSFNKDTAFVSVADIENQMGISFEADKFFNASYAFPLALQVYLRNPDKLNDLTDDILGSETHDFERSFNSFGELVLNTGVFQWMVDISYDKSMQTANRNINWRDEAIQERLKPFLE